MYTYRFLVRENVYRLPTTRREAVKCIGEYIRVRILNAANISCIKHEYRTEIRNSVDAVLSAVYCLKFNKAITAGFSPTKEPLIKRGRPGVFNIFPAV